jgi:hypothetical protein
MDLSIGTTGWAGDLVLSPSGDLVTVDGSALGVQRVIRRLFTTPQALLMHPEYGAGLLAKIGSPISVRTILGLVRAQMFKEAAVAQSPPPQIRVREVPEGSGRQVVAISYTNRNTGGPMLIQFRPGVTEPTH